MYVRETWTPEELKLLLDRMEDRMKAQARAKRGVQTEAEYFGEED